MARLTPQTFRNRKATAPDGPFPLHGGQSRAMASDAMILHLQSLWVQEASGFNVARHFDKAGFSSHDLVIGSAVFREQNELEWLRDVMRWVPGGDGGVPTPDIVSRLVVYLEVLSVDEEAIDKSCGITGSHAKAQRGLNELLLEHPVLLHPRLKIILDDVTGEHAGACSVAHAIMITRHAHFPRVTDWAESSPPTPITAMRRASLVRRLRSFAGSRLLELGLTTKNIEIANTHAAVDGRRALDHFGNPDWRPRLILSLQELAELRSPTPDSARFTDFDAANYGWLFGLALARGLVRAAGVNPFATLPERLNPRFEPDFVDLVRRHGPSCRDQLLREFRNQLFGSIFAFGSLEITHDGIVTCMHRLVDALVDGGLHATPVEAAQWIRSRVQEPGLPTLSTEQVVVFLRTLRDLGAPVEDDPRGVLAGIEVWRQGLHVVTAEDAMRSVLGSSDVAPARASTASTRRHRTGL